MADEELNLNIDAAALGTDDVQALANAIKNLRQQYKQLFDLANSSESTAAISAAKQAADELAASARNIRESQNAARLASRAANKQAQDELAASARSLSAQRKDALDKERADNKQAADELAASTRNIAATRRAAAAQERADNKQAADERAASARQLAADRKKQLEDERAAIRAKLEAERAANRQSEDELKASARTIADLKRKQAEIDKKAAAEKRASEKAERDAAREASRLQSQQTRAATAAQRALSQLASQALNAGQQAARQQARDAAEAEAAQRRQLSVINELIKRWLVYRAVTAGARLFKDFVESGIEFNKTIESANIGIASLIDAQTIMTDSVGRIVDGIDKFRVSQGLAAEQVNKLRIAGIQTTATTEQLVTAFQQAVGIGLRYGLTLDQIRQVTVQMTQAAGQLGLPLNQMNEEIRSLLAGTIRPQNTRIATALGITNEQVKQAQRAGNLFEFITERLQAFTVAGETTAQSFAGTMNRIRMALQVLTGDATKPLFDTLKTTGQTTLEEIFDTKNARISSKFGGIIEVAQGIFGQLGELLAEAIDSGVNSAEDLNGWLRSNRLEIFETIASLGEVAKQIGGILGDVTSLVTVYAQGSTEIGLWKGVLTGVADVLAGIRTLLGFIYGLFAAIGVFIVELVVSPLIYIGQLLDKIAQKLGKSLPESIRNTTKAMNDWLNDIDSGFKLLGRGFFSGDNPIQRFLDGLQTGTSSENAQKALVNLQDALEEIQYTEQKTIAKQDEALKKHVINQDQYNQLITKAKIDSLNKQIEAQKVYFNALSTTENRERRHTLTIIEQLKIQRNALERNITLKPSAPPVPPKDSAAQRERGDLALEKAKLVNDLKDLKAQFDAQKIGIQKYYDDVTRITQESIDRQIKIEERYRDTLSDSGAYDRVTDQIKILQENREQIIQDSEEHARQERLKLDKEANNVLVQMLKDQGRLVQANAVEMDNKYSILLNKLKAEAADAQKAIDSGILPPDKLAERQAYLKKINQEIANTTRAFSLDEARTALEEMQRRAKEVTQSLSTQLSAIETDRTNNAITEAEARERVVRAYENAHTALAGMLPQMQEFAAQTEDPNLIDSVEQLRIKIEQIGDTIRRTKDKWLDFKVTGVEATQNAIATTIENLPTLFFQDHTEIDSLRESLKNAKEEMDRLMAGPQTSESQARLSELRVEIQRTNVELHNAKDAITTWKDLFLDAARSIVQALQRLAAQMLATYIMQHLLSVIPGFNNVPQLSGTLSGGGGGNAGVLPAASGGLVWGPGTATSDSIPARLSAGEYVVNARAVKAVGVDFLHEINRQGSISVRGRRGVRGYAEGGLVTESNGGRGGFDATLSLERGLVVSHLKSRDGQVATLENIAGNATKVRQVLGLR